MSEKELMKTEIERLADECSRYRNELIESKQHRNELLSELNGVTIQRNTLQMDIKPKIELTHAALVERGVQWLRARHECRVIVHEQSIDNVQESPDVLGWNKRGVSILVECKVSASDYYRDRRKFFRQFAEMGMGFFRYYLTPPGLINPKSLAKGWGLAEVHGRRVIIIKEATAQKRSSRNEICHLIRLVRAAREWEWGESLEENYSVQPAADPELVKTLKVKKSKRLKKR